jgi:23S rRNA (adenine2503-C2)-methyltransferase
MKSILDIISSQPTYRLKQIQKAWFDCDINSYNEITTLPKDLREQMQNIPWLTVKEKFMQKSQVDDTRKALLELKDGNTIETVLMGREDKKQNSDTQKRFTICISTQIGCPMKCSFCATGQMGFTRNLTTEEIIDQYRFWQRFLSITPCSSSVIPAQAGIHSHTETDLDSCLRRNDKPNISNIVLMGQGEPFLNYDNVKNALNIILNNTEIGPRKITISTVGVKAGLEKMLDDKDFPPVRFALSLHGASEKIRAKIIPSHQTGFLDFLIDWSKKYHQTFPSRTHFIGLEYTLLKEINDSLADLKALQKLASKLGRVRINLIPFNCPTVVCHSERSEKIMSSSPSSTAEYWRDALIKAGFIATIRHSQGQDIAAACGQLQNAILYK